MQRIAFLADETHEAQKALEILSKSYGSVSIPKADVIVALGGAGFMLSTLHNTQLVFFICWLKFHFLVFPYI